MSNFTYGDEMLSHGNWRAYEGDELNHGLRQSISKYIGGFIKVGNRMNNSKAYNHDYYVKNKEKWKTGRPVGDATSKDRVYGTNPADNYDFYNDKSLDEHDKKLILGVPDVKRAMEDFNYILGFERDGSYWFSKNQKVGQPSFLHDQEYQKEFMSRGKKMSNELYKARQNIKGLRNQEQKSNERKANKVEQLNKIKDSERMADVKNKKDTQPVSKKDTKPVSKKGNNGWDSFKKSVSKAVGLDAKKEMDKAETRANHFEKQYSRVYDWNNYRDKNGKYNLYDYDKSRSIYEKARKNANEAFYQSVGKYHETPLGKVDSFLSDASWEVEYAYDTVKDFAKKTVDEIDYQIWSFGDDIQRAVKKRKKRKK